MEFLLFSIVVVVVVAIFATSFFVTFLIFVVTSFQRMSNPFAGVRRIVVIKILRNMSRCVTGEAFCARGYELGNGCTAGLAPGLCAITHSITQWGLNGGHHLV